MEVEVVMIMNSLLRFVRTGLLVLVPATALLALAADAVSMPLPRSAAANKTPARPGVQPKNSGIVGKSGLPQAAEKKAPPKGAIVKKKAGRPTPLPKVKKVSVIRR